MRDVARESEDKAARWENRHEPVTSQVTMNSRPARREDFYPEGADDECREGCIAVNEVFWQWPSADD